MNLYFSLQGAGENDYMCVCPLGFHGLHCEMHAQTCSDNPCKNGATCSDTQDGGYQCKCHPEFQGVNCDVKIDHCRATPCQNGGTCTLISGEEYQCRCPAGFTGRNCEVNVDDCAGNPCSNGGTCFDFVNDYKCYCHAGFVGRNCEQNVNDCLTNPCANGGTCHDSINDFICTCKPGFTGKDCSQEVNECASTPCMHGFCVDKLNDFECKCLPGYSGKHCNVLPDGTVLKFKGSVPDEMESSQVVLIATFSTLIPLLVLIVAVFLWCSKQRRRREQRRADLAAERENELNAVNCINKTKMLDDHMIVNSLDYPKQKCVNTNPNLAVEESFSAKDSVCSYKQMARGSKQLNTDYNSVVGGPSSSARASSSMLVDKLENASCVSAGSSVSRQGIILPTAGTSSPGSRAQYDSGPRYCNLVPPPSVTGLSASASHHGFESASTVSSQASSVCSR